MNQRRRLVSARERFTKWKKWFISDSVHSRKVGYPNIRFFHGNPNDTRDKLISPKQRRPMDQTGVRSDRGCIFLQFSIFFIFSYGFSMCCFFVYVESFFLFCFFSKINGTH